MKVGVGEIIRDRRVCRQRPDRVRPRRKPAAKGPDVPKGRSLMAAKIASSLLATLKICLIAVIAPRPARPRTSFAATLKMNRAMF